MTWRVDPYNLSIPLPEELREPFMLFACTVHGKTSSVQAKKCNELFQKLWDKCDYIPCIKQSSLMRLIKVMGDPELDALLHDVKIGQYRRVLKTWRGLANLEAPYTLPKLLSVSGIGPKTACFIAAYINGDNFPILDVHILAWLRSRGHQVPEQTPQDPEVYADCAEKLAWEAMNRQMTVAQLDRVIWNERANKDGKQK